MPSQCYKKQQQVCPKNGDVIDNCEFKFQAHSDTTICSDESGHELMLGSCDTALTIFTTACTKF